MGRQRKRDGWASSVCKTQAPAVSSAVMERASTVTTALPSTTRAASWVSTGATLRAVQAPPSVRAWGPERMRVAGAVRDVCMGEADFSRRAMPRLCASAQSRTANQGTV
jgi:hypothetical protein